MGGKRKSIVLIFCLDEYDDFRAMMMPYCWMRLNQEYFIPVARDESRPDIVS